MSDNRRFIAEYAATLNSKPKDPALVASYVADATLAEHIATFEAAFPGYQMTPEDIIAEGDRVAVRATFRGTHKGTFAGIAPTGRSISTDAIIIYRIAGDKIVQHWIQWNPATLIQQLSSASVGAGS
jgi:predicted ester cyclase